jgi:hemolysin activation/secretion protein
MDTSDTDNAWQNHNVSHARFGGGVDADNFWRHGEILYIGYRSAFQEQDKSGGNPYAKTLRLVALSYSCI